MIVMYFQGYRVARPGEEMCQRSCFVEEQLEMVLVSMQHRVRKSTSQNLLDLVVAFSVMHPDRRVDDLKEYLNRVKTTEQKL